MPLIAITEFETSPASSGVTLASGESKGRGYFRIGLSEAAQKELFGAMIDVANQGLRLVISNDQSTRHLMGIFLVGREHPEALSLSRGVRNSVHTKVNAWTGKEQGKKPSTSLEIVNRSVSGGGISVKLPPFAKPPAVHRASPQG